MLSIAPPRPFWATERATLYAGDCIAIMDALPASSFDLVFADPPYHLSNGGSTCSGGQRVRVHKGEWDKSAGAVADHAFQLRWLTAVRRLLAPNGTLWVSGTMHVIFSVGYALQELDFKLLNDVYGSWPLEPDDTESSTPTVWEKPNPPPNLGCRSLTHSTETLIWAARSSKSKYHFNYAQLREANDGKQLKNVWRLPAPGRAEKLHGKHPTQKPLALLDKVMQCALPPGGRVLDPFNGSGTTGVAALHAGASQYTGIDLDYSCLALSARRMG
jgi:site-specific DNA-methyltransferase (adenine-specific)